MRIFVLFFLVLSYSNNAWCKNANSFDHTKMKIAPNPKTAANNLLHASKWDVAYEKFRPQEVKYLLHSIDGPQLNGLDEKQKQQVLVTMQNIIIKQILEDKAYFKKYLISQYVQFFTIDELNTLTKYFQTPVMQMVVDAKINGQTINVKQIKDKLITATSIESSYVDAIENSYLYPRYIRFQEKIKPIINKLITDRLKELISFVTNNLSNIVENVKTQNLTINLKIDTIPKVENGN